MQALFLMVAMAVGIGTGAMIGMAIDILGAGISVGIAGGAAICGVLLAAQSHFRARKGPPEN